MKFTSLVIFLAVSGTLNGQIKKFRDYQAAINRAELSLVEGDKTGAFNLYYTTLTKWDGNFSKDIYNALLLSKELSRTDSFFILLNLLQKKGLSNSYINGLEEFKQFHSNLKWVTFLKINENYKLINKELKAEMDSIYIKDQFFRTKEGSYKIYGDTIKQIDSINMTFLFSLISKNKFPGENEIGVNSVTGKQGYDIVFHHYAQAASLEKKLNKITPLLINLVLEGKILPNKCAHWLEMQNGEFKAGVFDITGFKVNGKQVGYFKPVYGNVQKLIIDEYRKILCLESLEDYYKKFVFVIKNPNSKYNFDISINNFNVDEKTFSIWSKTMVELK